MASDRPNPTHIERQRVPLESKVSLKFKEFRGFLTEYSSNVSMGGMFLLTDRPQPPGSVFDFEFKLADEFSLIHGIGEVVWARQRASGPDHPAGMGVRFLHLDGAGQKLIRRMVKEHIDKGGIPFELGTSDDLATLTPSQEQSQPARVPSLRTAESPFSPPPPLEPSSSLQEELEKTRLGEIQERLRAEREELRADLAAFDPSPRAVDPDAEAEIGPDAVLFRESIEPIDPSPATPPGGPIEATQRGNDLSLAETAVLDEGAVLTDPADFMDQDPAKGSVPVGAKAPPLQASFLDPSPLAETISDGGSVADVPTTPFDVVPAEDSAETARPLPPGFDEVTRALGRSEPAVRYADPNLGRSTASTDRDLADSDTLPGVHPHSSTDSVGSPIPSSPSSPSSGAWRVPDPIPPYEMPQKKGGNALLITVGAVVAILFGVGYYLSTSGDSEPMFAPDSPPSDLAAASTDPLTPSGTNPQPVNAEPPTLESLVGLPEAEGTETPPTGEESATQPSLTTTAPTPIETTDEPTIDSSDDEVQPAAQTQVTLIENIRWTESDRATVITLVGNGEFTPESFTTFRLQGGQPREVVRLVGIEEGYRSGTLAVGTAIVRQIRLGHHIKARGPELHVVFDLEHIDAKLFTVEPNGKELMITLGPT